MKKGCAALALGIAVLAGTASAVTIHRSFRTRDVGFGGGAGVSVPVERRVAEALDRKAAEEAEKRLKIVGRVTKVEAFNVIAVTPNGGVRRRVFLEGVTASDAADAAGKMKRLQDLVYRKTVEVHYRLQTKEGDVIGLVRLKNGAKGFIDINATIETPVPDAD